MRLLIRMKDHSCPVATPLAQAANAAPPVNWRHIRSEIDPTAGTSEPLGLLKSDCRFQQTSIVKELLGRMSIEILMTTRQFIPAHLETTIGFVEVGHALGSLGASATCPYLGDESQLLHGARLCPPVNVRPGHLPTP